jgi:hypothetical protein
MKWTRYDIPEPAYMYVTYHHSITFDHVMTSLVVVVRTDPLMVPHPMMSMIERTSNHSPSNQNVKKEPTQRHKQQQQRKKRIFAGTTPTNVLLISQFCDRSIMLVVNTIDRLILVNPDCTEKKTTSRD